MIKIGNDNITLKVGSIDVDAVYLGSALMILASSLVMIRARDSLKTEEIP